MLVACLVTSLLFINVQSQVLISQSQDQEIIHCIVDILEKYFAEKDDITYVNMHSNDGELLKAIHSTWKFTLISRQPKQQMFNPNLGYLVSSVDVSHFTEYFEHLIQEPAWNPYARFLIVIKSLQYAQLRQVFDLLLRLHVNNVLLVNGTKDAHLYTYNPFDNYACGRYYNTVISYGLCSQTTNILYPNKLVTELKNCNFKASLAHRPPLSIDPLKTEENNNLLGTEEYIINVLGAVEQFTVTFNYSYNGDLFSTVAPNMTAFGPMEMLQKNECDIIFGGMMMVTSRAEAFTYLCGYHDYGDELQFAVKRSSLVPTWKYIYIEFELQVWILLLATLLIYTIITVILLRSQDKCEVLLRLVDNLLLHGREVHTCMSVKCVLITWVWFAYLINTFYQSSLFSLTTHPSSEYQISDEADIVEYELKPCFSHALLEYFSSETSRLTQVKYYKDEGCQNNAKAMDTVSTAKDKFTLVPNYFYLYNERKYNDKWGDPLMYYFDKPYTKFMYGYFFYKGFPLTHRLKLNALRIRESGLANKNLEDHYYARKLKQKFSQKPFEAHFIFPWCVCIPGCVLATITFVIELVSFKYPKWYKNILSFIKFR